ncbi:hypothetical protein [Serratia ureilytica]|uniref:hypothetical protein n=1 Tax=Serratia ureilytica TaxID=300181 RepID=UPI00159CBC7C|nr:hypothetical protein [Serratia ureilytica]MCW6016217.1 hypothetical protein [Serratia marcescens]NVM51961.1 hypothetical protein [Serratia ureilytica]HAV6637421.1 hypothetical protein [Serratia marcescens]
MYEIPKLEVKFYRKKWRIMVGKSSLSAFSKEEDAIKELAAKQGFYEYWAGSASVQAENTEPVIVIIDK